MSVKPDSWIRKMALEHKMIEPFDDRQVRDGVISYGVPPMATTFAWPTNSRFSPM